MNKLLIILVFMITSFSYANEKEIQFDKWQESTRIGEIEIESRLGRTDDNKVSARDFRARNYYDTDICVLSKIKNPINAKSYFYNDGKILILAGEQANLGFYMAKKLGKRWKVTWEFRLTKDLSRCK